MTFLFKMHRAEGIDPLAYRVAQEKARKAWKAAPRVYTDTFYEHLKVGDFDHLIPSNYYYLEDFSHLEHRLPADFVIPRTASRGHGSVLHSGIVPEPLPQVEPRPEGEPAAGEAGPSVPPWE